MSNRFDLIIHHGNCYDGVTAAWVARKTSPTAQFIAAQHGDAPPDVAGKRVLIVDFSYPRGVLEQIRRTAASVLVLDHHKTAAADLDGIPGVVFDMTRSGAGIAWDVLIGAPRPPIVDYVEDRDLWRFSLGGTKEFHAAMTSYPLTMDSIEAVYRRSAEEVVSEGRAIRRAMEVTARKFASRATMESLDGVLVWSVNVPIEYVSETAEVLKEREPHLPVLGWSWDGERRDWYCSIRSRSDGPDVSEIARAYGGGGHAHAAGFRILRPPIS